MKHRWSDNALALVESGEGTCTGIVELLKYLLHATTHPKFVVFELQMVMNAFPGQYNIFKFLNSTNLHNCTLFSYIMYQQSTKPELLKLRYFCLTATGSTDIVLCEYITLPIQWKLSPILCLTEVLYKVLLTSVFSGSCSPSEHQQVQWFHHLQFCYIQDYIKDITYVDTLW